MTRVLMISCNKPELFVRRTMTRGYKNSPLQPQQYTEIATLHTMDSGISADEKRRELRCKLQNTMLRLRDPTIQAGGTKAFISDVKDWAHGLHPTAACR